MRRIRKKLNNASGASMLLALLFLFFCLTVGAVVLTAASASAGRTARNRQEQQNYLAVESAALLLREDICSASFTGSYQKVKTTIVHEDPPPPGSPEDTPSTIWTETITTYGKNGEKTGVSSGKLLETASGDLSELYYCSVPELEQTLPTGFAAAYPLSFQAGALPGVEGTLTVGTGADGEIYTVTAVLYAADGDGGRSNLTTLVFRAQRSPESTDVAHNGDSTIYTYTTTVTWADPVITKGGAAS